MQKAGEAESRIDGFGLVFLVALTLGSLFLLLQVVPKFEQIYEDALPGKPLPPLTLFVLQNRIGLALLDLGLLIVSAVCAVARDTSANLATHFALIWNLLQGVMVCVALYMPMQTLSVGMSSMSP
jgi:type II secretory pathway component PulF